MEIITVVVSMFETNCYLAYDAESKSGVIIDPGDDAERIIQAVDKYGIRPEYVLLTHGHGDHVGAVTELLERYTIPLYAGKGEEALLSSAEKNMSAAVGAPVTVRKPDRLLITGDTVIFGAETLEVIATPGHSPGGVCYRAGNILFCGDTLFYGSVGRTDFPGCSHEKLISSINDKLMVLPDDTVCYPGHGPATTIGFERTNNPFLTGGYFV